MRRRRLAIFADRWSLAHPIDYDAASGRIEDRRPAADDDATVTDQTVKTHCESRRHFALGTLCRSKLIIVRQPGRGTCLGRFRDEIGFGRIDFPFAQQIVVTRFQRRQRFDVALERKRPARQIERRNHDGFTLGNIVQLGGRDRHRYDAAFRTARRSVYFIVARDLVARRTNREHTLADLVGSSVGYVRKNKNNVGARRQRDIPKTKRKPSSIGAVFAR